MKIKSLFTILLSITLATTACETIDAPNTPETPEQPSDTEEPEDTEEPGDTEKPEDSEEPEDNNTPEDPIHPELPEATYALCDNVMASVYTLETNGLRNDYVGFYEPYTDRTLFIDFYSPIEAAYLPSGVYLLGDGSSMTSAKEYTYITFETDGDLVRFVDGSATVTAHHDDESNTTTHKVTAYYTLESGETVSMVFDGIFTIKQAV